jgi:hypothetical protein
MSLRTAIGQLVLPFFAPREPDRSERPVVALREIQAPKPDQATARPRETDLARHALADALQRELDAPVDIRVTDNKRTMISSRFRDDRWVLRLHHMFLNAEPATIEALARFIRSGGRRGAPSIDEHIRAHSASIRQEPRVDRLRTLGHYHDLAEILDELNGRFFDRSLSVRITWGKNARPPSRRRRSIHLGTYHSQARLIRIHPALDQAWVPRFFVASVVYHELLHHVIPPPVRNGRQYYHCPEFRLRERAYPDYERAVAWEKAHIDRLLRSRPER